MCVCEYELTETARNIGKQKKQTKRGREGENGAPAHRHPPTQRASAGLGEAFYFSSHTVDFDSGPHTHTRTHTHTKTQRQEKTREYEED